MQGFELLHDYSVLIFSVFHNLLRDECFREKLQFLSTHPVCVCVTVQLFPGLK